MTYNYYLEYRFIPDLLEQVKQGRNPLQSLIDIRWMKEVLTNNHVEIDWDGFSVDVYDEFYTRTSFEKGKYIAYTFPKIISVPEAKYGVIDIEAKKYYTFESDYSDGYRKSRHRQPLPYRNSTSGDVIGRFYEIIETFPWANKKT